MGRSCVATVFWLIMALAVGEELPSETSGEAGDGANLISRDIACEGVTISLEGKVKAVEMEEFNISLTVSSSSAASRWRG